MGFWNELNEQLRYPPALPTADFTGKTVIVTGSNVGIGREAARHFVRMNAARVIMAVRTPSKGEAAKAEIISDPMVLSTRENLASDVVQVWQLDHTSYASVQAFAHRVSTELERVDVACLNAGVAMLKFEEAEEDELTITVNVVTTMLLAILLLPALRQTATKFNTVPVLSVVGSNVHSYTSFPERTAPQIFDHLADPKAARMDDRYSVSKLVQLFAVRELARLVSDTQPFVVVNTLNPGLCYTDLDRNGEGLFKIALAVMRTIMAWTAEQGSRTLIHAAVGGPATHGVFMTGGRTQHNSLSPFVTSAEGAETQKRIWNELSAKLEGIQPGIMATI
ncbi:NAD(P)-binding protein [Auricularia subglabra TFB-10046 SS5]|nr:NAD(P)-binding protein [Auricularia subglabra TFB-10046 SS5]